MTRYHALPEPRLPESVADWRRRAAAIALAAKLRAEPRRLLDRLIARTSAIDWQAPNRPVAWPSNATLARDCQCTVRSIKRRLAALEAAGLIERPPHPQGGARAKRHGFRPPTPKGPPAAVETANGIDLAAVRARVLASLPQAITLAAESEPPPEQAPRRSIASLAG